MGKFNIEQADALIIARCLVAHSETVRRSYETMAALRVPRDESMAMAVMRETCEACDRVAAELAPSAMRAAK